MPIIAKVGRRSWKVLTLNVIIHVVLLLGAVTMIYPFMIMVSSSFKSSVDSRHFSVWPRYFTNENELFRKYVEARYNEKSAHMTSAYKGRYTSFEDVNLPARPVARRYEDWQAFLTDASGGHGCYDFVTAERGGTGIYPRNNRAFTMVLKQETGGDIRVLNQRYGTTAESWDEVNSTMTVVSTVLDRRYNGHFEGILARYDEFRLALPIYERVYASVDGDFLGRELKQGHGDNLAALNTALGSDYKSWQNVFLARTVPEGPIRENWLNFVRVLLNLRAIRVKPEAAGSFHAFLKDRYETIDDWNRISSSSYSSFDEVPLVEEVPSQGQVRTDWQSFIENVVAPEHLVVHSVEFQYRDWLKQRYGGDLDALNTAHEKGYANLDDVELTPAAPNGNLGALADWTAFVLGFADPASLEVKATGQQDFLDFLAGRFPGPDGTLNLAAYNRAAGASHAAPENVYPPARQPDDPAARELWLAFVREGLDVRHLNVDPVNETPRWQEYLRGKYTSARDLNDAYGLLYTSFEEVPIDHWQNDSFVFREHKHSIFMEFLKRNYVMVLYVMLYNGRAVVNTLIYCLLAIATALLINPLAAYAMSRFKLPTTYKILLVLMLTMAFPPMVMGIPNFLMLKRLGLLNTFWALILPGAANGYFIFLLKGFFDSLPRELFECATLDGASERQIFWNVAMALSKPIMAVIALSTFNLAYRNFMFAFIVCQDKRMWTMMVHIYQLMQRSSSGVGFAALVLAAIPVFLVFVFCQNIIIRGIVVPTEK